MKGFQNSLVLLATLAVAGCGLSTGGAPQSMATSEAQVQDMVKARAIYDAATDKAYDNLSADQKTQYTKLVHATDEAGAKRWWSTMSPMPAAGGGGGTANMSNGPGR